MHDHRTDALHMESDIHHIMRIMHLPDCFPMELAAWNITVEYHRRQQARLSFLPDQVLIVFFLIDRLVSGQIEGKEFSGSVLLILSHCRDPVIMHMTRVISSVVIYDRSRLFIGFHLLPVDCEAALCMEEILLTVQRAVLSEGNADDTRLAETGQLEVIGNRIRIILMKAGEME